MSKWEKSDAVLFLAALFLLVSGLFCGAKMKLSGADAPGFLSLPWGGLLLYGSLPFLLLYVGTLLRPGILLQGGVVFCAGSWLGGCAHFGAFLPTLFCTLCVTVLFPRCAKLSFYKTGRSLARRARIMAGKLSMLFFLWGGSMFCWLIAKFAAA